MITDYNSARSELLNLIKKEIMGPGSEDVGISQEYEIITDKPINRYTVGMLFPQQTVASNEGDIEEGNSVNLNADIDETLDTFINMANQYYPSAMGISFYTEGICPSLRIEISTARYQKIKEGDECVVNFESIPEKVLNHPEFSEKIESRDKKLFLRSKLTSEEMNTLLKISDDKEYRRTIFKLYGQSNRGWKRIPINLQVDIPSETDRRYEQTISDRFKLVCIRRAIENKKTTLFTISVVNEFKSDNQRNDELTHFQTELKIYSLAKGKRIFKEYEYPSKLTHDPELNSYKLLYRKRKLFAVGHGCSANWEKTEEAEVSCVYTENIPSYEAPSLHFDIPEVENTVPEILDMKNLSDTSDLDTEEVIQKLNKFCNVYEDWIETLKREKNKVPEYLKDIASAHIRECHLTCKRMKAGVALLQNERDVLTAFQLANRAMFMQRLHSDIQKNKRLPNEDNFVEPDYEISENRPGWRPFQLAFILLCLNSISNPKSKERENVDLIWFRTAGGKTEAYLGLSAFVIFLRLLKDPIKGQGTAIIMRYTLRLLTTQQFQRASTLICACEIIRRENEDLLGKKSISIGLWIGGASTPNTIQQAFYDLRVLTGGGTDKNPFQLLSCPWCGTKMVKEKDRRGIWGYTEGRSPRRFMLFCPEKKCEFHYELPIKVIDEDIYRDPPALLFGTIDKFALLPWKHEISKIFAIDNDDRLSPELIIQDELHLISGPLGTISGLYETAIDIICSAKGIRPKIVTSTATIRRAEDQCKALYSRTVKQFPPPGLSIEDSFFAREISTSKRPGRLFAGVMSSGKTHTTTIVRVMGATLQSVYELKCDQGIKNPYWTLVGFYNSLRELGQNVTLVNDDIKDYIIRMGNRKGILHRRIYEPQELTSRIHATEIPDILEKLLINFPDPRTVRVLLATNMIATGVDIDRLGLMLIVGQPKTTSEYIQATSRIGRKFPGLVVTIYNGAKSRDRSHFEHFIDYHQAFYRYVEPTTVTPFSSQARERCLHAILITIVRHLLGYRLNNQAREIKSEDIVKDIKKAIVERAKNIDSKEALSTAEHIDSIIKTWVKEAAQSSNLVYGSPLYGSSVKRKNSQDLFLMVPAGREIQGVWPTLTSMRNVDAECRIRIVE